MKSPQRLGFSKFGHSEQRDPLLRIDFDTRICMLTVQRFPSHLAGTHVASTQMPNHLITPCQALKRPRERHARIGLATSISGPFVLGFCRSIHQVSSSLLMFLSHLRYHFHLFVLPRILKNNPPIPAVLVKTLTTLFFNVFTLHISLFWFSEKAV